MCMRCVQGNSAKNSRNLMTMILYTTRHSVAHNRCLPISHFDSSQTIPCGFSNLPLAYFCARRILCNELWGYLLLSALYYTYVNTLVALSFRYLHEIFKFWCAIFWDIKYNIIDILLKSFLFSMHTSFAFNKVWEFLKFD